MSKMPMKPGYYWAKWRIAAEGTVEGDELTPSDFWEIVQVNENDPNWERNPAEDMALSVSLSGVSETQWRDCFVWGDFVAPLNNEPLEALVAAPTTSEPGAAALSALRAENARLKADLAQLRSEQARWTNAVVIGVPAVFLQDYMISSPCAEPRPKPDVLYIDGAVYRMDPKP
ncbi:MAG: hypothetical protein E5V72_01465 [Mesorhizobium sp.]|uniref:hypothetical protein n=1 Tax=Mesorhizobium sp. TaxID=1871066 RepID=UPI000FE93A76|nr:hypothetical protein [Mesorhizobium sp.]RWH52267.1 MAG: hypothetical protein EOQ82_26585 [Mesorhizobium sp.]RWI69700.1 MAG: hypothetical protein EOR18_20950 [Mesorhizobium sp.]RWI76167.1 MAG: hypothetical protein EOR19_18540 [Mesorhizobium sp.]RWJ33237.1 MAG: hypothetical protein EOR28_11670 [Mesorhizobium sp.]TIQ74067.1 MAG: hypothetical protein E5X40_06770 [Mesorhizobium sp.]